MWLHSNILGETVSFDCLALNNCLTSNNCLRRIIIDTNMREIPVMGSIQYSICLLTHDFFFQLFFCRMMTVITFCAVCLAFYNMVFSRYKWKSCRFMQNQSSATWWVNKLLHNEHNPSCWQLIIIFSRSASLLTKQRMLE